ncbi:hypothetical protein FAZ95_03445 [Trinickia violacea]|uniref:NERD domain-containing protein n=1 Tax=Trinickia violacea TaxID=2571746 RepID=A0A4V1EGX8_9BURK|nr:hypothetical protein [Trinickia violacea]QCP48320.1 hypothetical protein FAZ95_03445 [Trinickia violacea]
MTGIEEAATRLGTKPWTAEAIRSELPVLRPLVAADLAWLKRTIEDCFKSGNARRTEDLLCLALLHAEELVLGKIRSWGHFRASRYGYDGAFLMRVLTKVTSRVGGDMTADGLAYLQSIIALTVLSKEAVHVRTRLTATLREKKSIALKSAYAELDLAFQILEMSGRDPTSTDHSIEELGEGLSLLTYLYFECVTVEPYNFGLVDEDGLRSGLYRRMLEDAMLLRQIGEAETLVDAYGYVASASDGRITVRARDERLEQSIRLGYIQFALSSILISQQWRAVHADLPSCGEFVDALRARSSRRWLRLLMHPIPRYALMVPGSPSLREQLSATPFREEVVQVETTAYNMFCKPEELLGLKLKNGLPVEEARQVQRYVDILRTLFWRELGGLHALDEPISMRSRIPVFSREDLKKLLSTCVLPEYVDRVIDALSHSRQREYFFDIQYRPILEVDGRYIVPLNILGMSNVFRNLLQSTETRIQWPNDRDPVQVMLGAALKTAGFRALAPLKTRHEGRELDIDVLAMRGDTLYLFECKNPIHPTGIHELRRSLNYAQDAAGQLDRAAAAFQDKEKRAQLFQRLGWVCPPQLRIRTCVMMGNRMLNGWTVGGHPVRSVREAVRLLETGTVGIFDREYRTWKTRHATKVDLDEFLSEDSFAVQSLRLMESVQRSYQIGKASLTFNTFALDLVKLTFATDSTLPRANLRVPSLRRARHPERTNIRRRPSIRKPPRHYFGVTELATWLGRPARTVRRDANREPLRVPPMAGPHGRRALRWDRAVVRKWFGIESDDAFQRELARKFRDAKAARS